MSVVIERAGKRIARLSPVADEVLRPRRKLEFPKAAGLGKMI
jgi:hypothetical protein